METEEREAYRNFIRYFYTIVYHMPEYATAEDYERLLQPLCEEAEMLLGTEEIATIETQEPYLG